MSAPSRSIFIDSDNALGARRGDVDDGYALAALFAAGADIAALSSCAGNTAEMRAHQNNLRIAELFDWRGPVLRGAESRAPLRDFTGRVLALGPLTNVVTAARATELVIVGGNATSRGRWPPFWPFEFNLTKDRAAARAAFALDVPLTLFPLDVACQLTASAADVDALPGAVGEYLRRGSERWFRHLRRVRFTSAFPVYDLAAALYVLDEDGFTFRETTATMRTSTSIDFGHGGRAVKLCVALDRDTLWRRFVELLTQHAKLGGVSKPVG